MFNSSLISVLYACLNSRIFVKISPAPPVRRWIAPFVLLLVWLWTQGIPNKLSDENQPISCNYSCLLSDVTKMGSECKYSTLRTQQFPFLQMCQAHVGVQIQRHVSYGAKTWSTNIFYFVIIQNEWKFLSPPQKNISHSEHRAGLPTMQEHKYHLSCFVQGSSRKVEKWLRDKWF